MLAEAFYFNLPKDAIAQHPVNPRDSAKVWVMDSPYGMQPLRFRQFLPKLLAKNDILVVNNCKTIAGRIDGITKEGKRVTVTFCGSTNNHFYVLAKPAKHLVTSVYLGEYLKEAEVVAKGERYITLRSQLEGDELLKRLHLSGQMPLPLYVKRAKPLAQDRNHYQTIFAKQHQPKGAATPTASLHFTPQVLATLRRKGVKIVPITLVVGGATFLPMRAKNVEDHPMEGEYVEISQPTASAINRAKQTGGKVIAVGTTSLRAIEAVAMNKRIAAFSGFQNLFIKPQYKFKIADGLITNFPPPLSSALVLVSAIDGVEKVKRAYNKAYRYGFRFFSYGDCCFFDISKGISKNKILKRNFKEKS